MDKLKFITDVLKATFGILLSLIFVIVLWRILLKIIEISGIPNFLREKNKLLLKSIRKHVKKT